MTIDELRAIDPMAMWASLSPEAQASIIQPLLTSVFAEVCQDDDGTDCSAGDQNTAAGIVQDCHQKAYDAIETAFYEVLGPDHTALHEGPTVDMIDGFGKVAVKGVRGRRVLRQTTRYSNSVKIGGRKVEIAGFKNIGTEDDPVWEAWTQAHVDDERVRRHPDQAVGPPLPAPTFRSVIEASAPSSTTHHEDHSYDRAA